MTELNFKSNTSPHFIKLNDSNNKDVARICYEYLTNNKIILIPTETFYVIGCIFSKLVLSRLTEIKKTKDKKVFSIMCNFYNLNKLISIDNHDSQILKNYLPGPFTLLFAPNKNNKLSRYFINNNKISVRMPEHQLCADISELIPYTVITTANRSGNLPVAAYRDLDFEIVNSCDLVVEGPDCYYASPTTVIDVVEKKIIKPGAKLNIAEELVAELNNSKT